MPLTERRLVVAMACDGDYLYPWAVALASLARHASQPFQLVFGAASDWPLRLGDDDVQQVLRLAEILGVPTEFTVLPVAVADLPPTLHISPTAFVKPALFDACPPGEQRVWLDADMIAIRDWTSVSGLAGKHPVSAVREAAPAFEEAWPASDGSRDWHVNTGLIVVDGTGWQEDYAGRWQSYLESYVENGFRYLDQDVLNALVRSHWNALPEDFNWRPGHSGEWSDPAIVHYAGWWKPWLRTRRQTRLLSGGWSEAFERYREAEGHLVDEVLASAAPVQRRYWMRQRRHVRGVGGWRAARHYVRGVTRDAR